MKARVLICAAMGTMFAGVLAAVDVHLLGLAMPEAKVLAGVNVVSAKNSPFGQYILSQMAPNGQEFQKMAALAGFDPRQDLIELLAASDGVPGSKTGLVLATGTFNTSAILAAVAANGAASESYRGAMIVTEPNQKGAASAIAFLGSTIAIAGDVASVRGAIDRQSAPARLDAGLAAQASALSGNEDAWIVSMVPPPAPPNGQGQAHAPAVPGVPVAALQQIQSGSAGVKFGANVVVTAQAQTDTAQTATSLAGMLQLLSSMAKLQANKNPQAAALATALAVTSTGNTVNVTFTLPEGDLQQLMTHPKQPAARRAGPHRK